MDNLFWRDAKRELDQAARGHGAQQALGVNVERWLFVEVNAVLRRALEGHAALIVTFQHQRRHAILDAVGRMLDLEEFHRIRQPGFGARVQQRGAGDGPGAELPDLAQQPVEPNKGT